MVHNNTETSKAGDPSYIRISAIEEWYGLFVKFSMMGREAMCVITIEGIDPEELKKDPDAHGAFLQFYNEVRNYLIKQDLKKK
jgi:hypothetical protein